MSRIAFINAGRFRDYEGRAYFSDPVHLVAMHHLCQEAGHTSAIIQLGYPTLEDSTSWLQEWAPDVIALSFLAPYEEDLEAVQVLLRPFRGKSLGLLLGGPEMDLDGAAYVGMFRPKYPEEWRFVAAVQGPGERLIRSWAAHDFRWSDAFTEELQREGVSVSWQEGVARFSGLKPIPLDQQAFERDYDWSPFRGKACVKWATGCWAVCSFCYNVPQRSDYRSPTFVTQEVQHLVKQGVKSIDIASPQFTAHPNKASAVIEALPPNTPPLNFTSRIDSFYHAMTRHESVWKRFANQQTHQIDFGVESFLPGRLLRMRKYHKRPQAEAQAQQIEAILEFFVGTPTRIVFYLIPLDWEMDFDEAEREAREALRYLNAYPNTLSIFPENVGKMLAHSKGSPLSKSMEVLDFFRFEKEPGLLLLHLGIDRISQRVHKLLSSWEESSFLLAEIATRVLLKEYLKMIAFLRETSSSLELEQSLQVLLKNPDSIASFAQVSGLLSEVEEQKWRRFLHKREQKLLTRLRRELDEWLSRKALAKMKQQGIITEQRMQSKLQKYETPSLWFRCLEALGF